MNQCCFICNSSAGLSLRNATSIFGEHNTLQSGKKLSEVLNNIIEKTLVEDKVHTSIMCKKCFKSCSEYDLIETRLQKLKAELLNQFKESLISHKLEYDNYENNIYEKNTTPPPVIKQPVVLGKKLVLPASKLQPVPPALLLKVGNIPTLSKKNIILPHIKTANASTVNLKVTVGSSVLTQTIKTTTTTRPSDKSMATLEKNILPSLSHSIKDEIDSIVTSQCHTTPKTSIMNFNVNSLPKNFFSEAVLTKIEGDGSVDDDGEKGGDQSMEIDEDASLAEVPVTSADDNHLVFEVDEIQSNKLSSDTREFLDVDLPTLGGTGEEHKYIVGKVQILNEGEDDIDEDEDEHTIVLDSENSSILQMVSGQKFIYEGGEISLVMADDDEEEPQPDDSNDLNDGQDSNDETAIELQMAGDEETAKAILAAAQEQGGAFIKVESGEMYRVQTVDQRRGESTPTLVVKDGDNFKCLLCENAKTDDSGPVVTGDAESMMKHLKRFHDARIYICQFCSAIMRKRNEYTTHIAEHASKLKSTNPRSSHICSTCGKSFGSRVLLMEHANVHAGLRPYRCDLCHKSFASKYTHQAHLKTHANRPRPYRCEQCGKTFLTSQNLTQHEKTHSGIKDFICNICNKAFSTQHNLEVHGVVHSGNKAFVCSVCGKAFARRAELRDHMRIHTGERPFECDICGARFTQRSNLHSHRRATHLDDKRYHCTQCPKKFKRRRLLEYHIKATHTGERPLKCKVCGSSFVYPEHYKKHIRIHSGERPYICEVCGKSFNSRDNRNTHRFIHSDKKPYECMSCGAGFMRKQLLYAHMNTSGHLTQSIVVNQPRLNMGTENKPNTKDIEKQELQPSVKFDTIFEVMNDGTKSDVKAPELDQIKLMCNIISDDKKLILEDADKGTLSLIQDNENPTLLTIHNLEERQQSELGTVTSEQLNEQNEWVASADNEDVVRLIQIKLPDGNNGWVALNNCDNVLSSL